MTLSAEVVYTSLLSSVIKKSPFTFENIRFKGQIVNPPGGLADGTPSKRRCQAFAWHRARLVPMQGYFGICTAAKAICSLSCRFNRNSTESPGLWDSKTFFRSPGVSISLRSASIMTSFLPMSRL